MATKKAEKEVKVTEKSPSSVRIVLDVPSASLERFKILCSLVGDTQSSLVTKAMDSYVDDRKELIEQFIALRTKVKK